MNGTEKHLSKSAEVKNESERGKVLKILIINIDSKIQNLALKKIEKYHADRGDEIVWDNELMKYSSDKIYVSCVFDWNKYLCEEWEGIAEIGGSGYSLTKNLPKEIDDVKIKINYGFTTRGCIRKCPFCIVHKKEGYLRVVGDIYDFWDGKSKNITIMDNNILAVPEHFRVICSQIKKENLMVDFNQGLDHRLLTDEICKTLLSIRNKEIRFSFDSVSNKKSVLAAIEILKNNGRDNFNTRWYVYVGENDTFETVYERLSILKENRQGAYVMRDRKIYSVPMFIALAQWANTMGAFKMGTFREVFNKSEKLRNYRKYIPNSYLKN